jgi:hypothetical protein
MVGKKAGGVEQRQKQNLRVKELERVYKFVLGGNFWYETSTIGCNMDLFLWSLLMRRKEVFWPPPTLSMPSSDSVSSFWRSVDCALQFGVCMTRCLAVGCLCHDAESVAAARGCCSVQPR